jgi:hypothetical protein
MITAAATPMMAIIRMMGSHGLIAAVVTIVSVSMGLVLVSTGGLLYVG